MAQPTIAIIGAGQAGVQVAASLGVRLATRYHPTSTGLSDERCSINANWGFSGKHRFDAPRVTRGAHIDVEHRGARCVNARIVHRGLLCCHYDRILLRECLVAELN